MNKIILPAAILSLFLLSSCLTTLHGLVTHETVVLDDQISGTWKHDKLDIKVVAFPESDLYKELTRNSKSDSKQIFDKKEDSLLAMKSYVIEFIKSGYRYYMLGSLTRIGDDTYINIQPAFASAIKPVSEKDVMNFLMSLGYIPSQSIARVDFKGSELHFRFFNGEFIREQMQEGRLAIKHENDELFGSAVITASAEDLRSYISKYGDDERLYSKENTVILKKN